MTNITAPCDNCSALGHNIVNLEIGETEILCDDCYADWKGEVVE